MGELDGAAAVRAVGGGGALWNVENQAGLGLSRAPRQLINLDLGEAVDLRLLANRVGQVRAARPPRTAIIKRPVLMPVSAHGELRLGVHEWRLQGG
jgi:hypothetical protein